MAKLNTLTVATVVFTKPIKHFLLTFFSHKPGGGNNYQFRLAQLALR